MFCYQCEQTSKGEGCQTLGVCGKDETTAALQDLLIHAVKGISMYAHRARQLGKADAEIDSFTIHAIFATLTNVNFDPERLVELIHQAVAMRSAAQSIYERASVAAGFFHGLDRKKPWVGQPVMSGEENHLGQIGGDGFDEVLRLVLKRRLEVAGFRRLVSRSRKRVADSIVLFSFASAHQAGQQQRPTQRGATKSGEGKCPADCGILACRWHRGLVLVSQFHRRFHFD